MSRISLKTAIGELSPGNSANYSGAVFLTYTLNLGFFEQIIQPTLEQTGCQNILILSDLDGYQDAIESGSKNVRHAGTRYVCSQVPRQTRNVQHVKLVFLVSESRGCVLLGSGNLTLHGYSKNLEVFTQFRYDHNNPDIDTHYALVTVKKFLDLIISNKEISQSSKDQYHKIIENISWLETPAVTPENNQIWHNFSESLWDQLLSWRESSPHGGIPLNKLYVFAPFFDSNFDTLNNFQNELLPDEIFVHISPETSNFSGTNLLSHWQGGINLPNLCAIKDVSKKDSDRYLHGKVLIGIEEKGSWCLAGSANMTRAAYKNTWRTGSNLEMISFHASENPYAFDRFIENIAWKKPLSLDEIDNSINTNQFNQINLKTPDLLMLTEFTFDKGKISGRLNFRPDGNAGDYYLILPKIDKTIKIFLDENLEFTSTCEFIIKSSQIGYIQAGNFKSLPRWLDFPEELRQYGTRSYQHRIKSSLETIEGTEKLFYELMKYLEEAESLSPGPRKHQQLISQKTTKKSGDDEEIKSAPRDPERFIVPERDANGYFILDNYTNIPYDRQIKSLHDLLSIILLRLTLSDDEQDPISTIEPDPDEDESKPEFDFEQEKLNAQLRISKYIVRYCKQYGNKICDLKFFKSIPFEVLIDKHQTLCRVLLEFRTHIDEFSTKDFQKCFWWIWSPFAWADDTKPSAKSVINLIEDPGSSEELLTLWPEKYLQSIFIVMMSLAFGKPLSWSAGLNIPREVNKFLIIKELTHRIESFLGKFPDDLIEPDQLGISQFEKIDCLSTFSQIHAYLPPAEERISPIFEMVTAGFNLEQANDDFWKRVEYYNLEEEIKAYCNNPKPIRAINSKPDDEGNIYCSLCGGALRIPEVKKIQRAKLVLCTNQQDAWLYKREIIENYDLEEWH